MKYCGVWISTVKSSQKYSIDPIYSRDRSKHDEGVIVLPLHPRRVRPEGHDKDNDLLERASELGEGFQMQRSKTTESSPMDPKTHSECFPMNLRREAVKKERIRCLISGLKRFEQTEAESQFIWLVEQHLDQIGPLNEIAELMVEGIYRQKTEFIRHSVMSMLKPHKSVPSASRRVPPRLYQ